MKIGSHNSMSYAPPEKWYYKPFHFICRCQSKPIETQYVFYNIRLFDIRIRWDNKSNTWKFSHGSITFKTKPVEEIFDWLNKQGDCIVRLILEYNKPVKNMSKITDRFMRSAEKWKRKYDNITWFGFNRKYDWEKLLIFEDEPNIDMYQAISSMTSLFSNKWSWLDDWCPWLYAKLQNKDNVSQGTCHEYLMLDFVEIQ